MPRLVAIFVIALAASAQLFSSKTTFGGSANDTVAGVVTDAAGNIYVAGTTSSFDFPVRNAFQGRNPGTGLIRSVDSGNSWQPLASPFAVGVANFFGIVVATDPRDAEALYAASGSSFCKSDDSGASFICSVLPYVNGSINALSIAVDPFDSAQLYTTNSEYGGVYKSPDRGQTWTKASLGLPDKAIVSALSFDPFHKNLIYTCAGSAGYFTTDGAVSWQLSSVPNCVGNAFAFDQLTPNVISASSGANGRGGIYHSVDGGKTWELNGASFVPSWLASSPVVSGKLYAVADRNFERTTDGGGAWTSSPIATYITESVHVDPFHPNILIAGSARSTDDGATWKATYPSVRSSAFSKTTEGVVYATTVSTSDAFLAKYLPDGKTPVFATYFGGRGTESASGIAIDSEGNVWLSGNTDSTDLPVSANAFQSSLKGGTDAFAAKFSSNGEFLAATYLGGAGYDNSVSIATSATGGVWLIGTGSSDFPLQIQRPNLVQTTFSYIAQLNSDASRLVTPLMVDGYFSNTGKQIAGDSKGNVGVVGFTTDPAFPVTPGAWTPGAPPSATVTQAFLQKYDAGGSLIYSTYFGGVEETATVQGVERGNRATAVAFDSTDNIYVAGNTAAPDFPVTAGAYQSSIHSGCSYPASTSQTFGPLSITYRIDDVFLTKLDAGGKSPIYSTLLGSSCYEYATGLAVDVTGRAYVAGETDGFDFPLKSPFEAAPAPQQYRSFVSMLSADGSSLEFSSYLSAGSMPTLSPRVSGDVVLGGSSGAGAQTANSYYVFQPFPPATPIDAVLINLSAVGLSAVDRFVAVNAFSLRLGPVSAGEIIALQVPDYTPTQNIDLGLATQAYPTQLGGTQVLFDGMAAQIISVSSDRIYCVVPDTIVGNDSTTVQIQSGAVERNVTLAVAPFALGLLSSDGSGSGLADIRNMDGTANGPNNPAAVGSKVTVYLTGVGEEASRRPGQTQFSVSIDGSTNLVPYRLPGFVRGLSALDFTVRYPLNKPLTDFYISTGDYSSQALQIYIQ